MTTQTKFKPTIQEIHQQMGEPFKLEIGHWTMDGYTGDAVYYHGGNKKHHLTMHVDYYENQVELRVDIISLYGHQAKSKAVLIERIRDILGWTTEKIFISTDRYRDTKGYFMLAARNENEMKALVEAAQKVLKEMA